MPQRIGLAFGDGEELDYHGVVAQQDASIPRLDRPAPPWVLTALVSVLTFGAGLALVGATFGEPINEGEGSEAAPAESESSDSEPSPGAELQGQIANAEEAGVDGANPDSEAADLEPVADVVEEGSESEILADEAVLVDADSADPTDSVEGDGNPEGEGNAPSTAEAPALPTSAVQGRMQRGRLAYLRCGELADDAGRCPRDRELEASVWTQLSAVIPRCGVGLGSGDARLRFDGDAPTVTFREFGDTPLDAEALTACVTPYVGALRTQLGGSFTFSMRFELR